MKMSVITLHLHRDYTGTAFKTKWQDLVDHWISNGRCKICSATIPPIIKRDFESEAGSWELFLDITLLPHSSSLKEENPAALSASSSCDAAMNYPSTVKFDSSFIVPKHFSHSLREGVSNDLGYLQ
jgi:hypothetical protein